MIGKSIGWVVTCLMFWTILGPPALAQHPKAPNQNIQSGFGAAGYDIVSYFQEDGPKPGSAEFSVIHNGVRYQFASARNLALYLSDPEQYTPQYGGYCALGLSVGRKFPIDPMMYNLVNDQLYLFRNARFRDSWAKKSDQNIERGDHNWPLVRELEDAELSARPPEGVINSRP